MEHFNLCNWRTVFKEAALVANEHENAPFFGYGVDVVPHKYSMGAHIMKAA